MTNEDLPAINFTLSPACAAALRQVREDYDREADDPAAALSVSWGFLQPDGSPEPTAEGVIIGIYTQSMLPQIARGIRKVAGLDLIFFTIPQHAEKFAGKVLDYSRERGFFLGDS